MCPLGILPVQIHSNRCSSQCSVAIQAENRKIAKYMCTGFFLYNFVPIAFKMMGTLVPGMNLKDIKDLGKELHCIQWPSGFFPPYSIQRLAVEMQSGNTASILGITSLLVDDYSSFFFFACFVVSMLLLSVPSVCFIYCFILHLQKKHLKGKINRTV